jgi:hypothetical protein
VERARIVTRLAYIDVGSELVSEAPTGTESLAREAVELARGLRDPEAPDALQEALYILHYTLAGPDHFEEREELHRELLQVTEGASAIDPAVIAVLDVACDRIAAGDSEGARERRAEAERMCGTRPHLSMAWHLAVYDTGLALMQGRLGEIESRARQARGIGARLSHPFAAACYSSHRVCLARDRGDAEEVVRRMLPALGVPRNPKTWVRAMIGRAHVELGNVREASDAFRLLAQHDFEDVPRCIRWTSSVLEIGALAADLGEAGAAERLCELLGGVESHHGVLPVPICYGGPVRLVLGRLRDVMGFPDEALELCNEALDSVLANGARPFEARIQLEIGRLLARRGDRGAARERVAACEQTAEVLGMQRLAAQARSELSAL